MPDQHVAYSPEPWTLVPQGLIQFLCTRTGNSIMTLTPTSPEGVLHFEANARLIAAAPELLAVVKAFLRAPTLHAHGAGSSSMLVQDFNLRAAYAALAKAESTPDVRA